MSKLTNITPGPWEAVEHHQGKQRQMVITHNQAHPGAITWKLAVIPVRKSWQDEAIANARAIALLPDIIDAANSFIGEIEDTPLASCREIEGLTSFRVLREAVNRIKGGA